LSVELFKVAPFLKQKGKEYISNYDETSLPSLTANFIAIPD